MNILQIANKAIFPPDGGNIALLNLSKAYSKLGNQVQILNMITDKHYNNLYKIDNIHIKGVEINTKISILKALINILYSKVPYIASRFYTIKFADELKKLLLNNRYDFIQIEGLYCLQYINVIDKIYKGKIVYRPHNLEYLIWERNAIETKNILKKLYFKFTAKSLQKLEYRLLNRYDYILPISQFDADIFYKMGNVKPLQVTPFGIETKETSKKQNYTEQKIKYIGALDWIPNQKGLIWFLDNCFPILLKRFPNLVFTIAGRNAPDWLVKKLTRKNIDFLGEIEESNKLFSYSGPFIVPLFSGSGMRVKIIEAMSQKNAIVSTKTGAEGINYVDGKNILIADNAEKFTQHIIGLLNDNNLQKTIGENSYNFVKENYDFINIADTVLKFIQ